MPRRSVCLPVALAFLGINAIPETAEGIAIARSVIVPSDTSPTQTTTPLNYDPDVQFCQPLNIGGGGGGGGGGDQFPLDAFLARFSGSLTGAVLSADGTPTTAPLGGFFSRRTLNAFGAYGAGAPDGFQAWPDGSQPGDLSGMNWPYRDFMNVPQSVPSVPGGFDASARNGDITPFGILNINAAQNPQEFGARSNAGQLGLRGFESIFDAIFEDTSRVPRTIRFTFTIDLFEVRLAGSNNTLFTNFDLERVTSIDVFIPSPGAAGVVLCSAFLAARRRRSSTGSQTAKEST